MSIERETIVTPVERETIVTERRGGSSGILLGIAIAFVVLLLIGGYTAYNGGFSFGGKSVTLDIPKVTVTQ
ncbi:hypothetical protein [Devosia sp.]|uniref:hypothetical protein n=1 Tax=Devosia sp. TaxID=1871048 RepID=UPI003BACB17D